MRIKLLSIFIVFLLFLATGINGGMAARSANIIPSLDVPDSVSMIVGQGGSTSTTFIITNNGTTNITVNSITFSQANFTDNDGDLITLTFSGYGAVLIPSSSETATVKAAPTDKVDINTYTGIVTVSDTVAGASDTFTLSVLVGPELCKDGEIGDLEIDIKEPDNGDEFKPNEKINMEVEVRNEGSDDLNDVMVEAVLVDLTNADEIENSESEQQDVDEGDEANFDFDLIVPIDPNEIDQSNTYGIFFKAFEDGNEDEQCSEDFLDMEIKLEKHDMIIENVVFTPSVVKRGELVTAKIKVLNIGESDEEDVFVVLKETGSLGINVESTTVSEIKEFKDEDDNSATISVTFTVPEAALDGEYHVNVAVFFDNGDESSDTFQPLTVSGAVAEEPLQEKPVVQEPVVIEDSFDLSQKTTAETTGFAFLSSFSPFSPRSWSIVTLGIADIVLVILGIYLIVLIVRRF